MDFKSVIKLVDVWDINKYLNVHAGIDIETLTRVEIDYKIHQNKRTWGMNDATVVIGDKKIFIDWEVNDCEGFTSAEVTSLIEAGGSYNKRLDTITGKIEINAGEDWYFRFEGGFNKNGYFSIERANVELCKKELTVG